MNILYSNWAPVHGDSHQMKGESKPIIGAGPLEQEPTREAAEAVGEMVFQKSKRAEKWCWIGICTFLVLATFGLTSVIITHVIAPFFMEDTPSFLELLAGFAALAVSAAAVIVAIVIFLIVVVLVLFFIGRKWGWEKPHSV